MALLASPDGPSAQSERKADNKAMAFLKKIGKVGGAANKDFRYAIGIDEGPAGKTHGGNKVRTTRHVTTPGGIENLIILGSKMMLAHIHGCLARSR